MPVVEERLTLLEVKMQEVGATLIRMESMLSRVHQMVLSLDQRVLSLDQRVDKLDQGVDRLELRIDKLDDRMLKMFLWVIGIQMTTLITIAGGLFALVAKLVPNP